MEARATRSSAACARVIVPGPGCGVVEAIVDVGAGVIEKWDEISHVRPTLLMHEAAHAIGTIRANPEYLAALARRGITADMIDRVQIDPWPAGVFGYDCEDGRRISRCISFLRDDQTDNGYARPIEGLIVHFDNGRNEVLEVIDHGVTPMPTEAGELPRRGSTAHAHRPEADRDHPARRAELHASRATSCSGRSGSSAIAFDPFEGLVLHQVAYNDDDGRVRPILHRASISEMVVPYGDPDPLHGWKNAFDAGEWGLGRMTQSLQLGCDCLGEIHYFDATLATEHGKPWVIENAICMHEEDYGILWKHVDLWGGTSEVRRSRRLVVSFISTVGNYEYGFFWYFYLDGNIQLEVKLTGIVSPMAIEPGATTGVRQRDRRGHRRAAPSAHVQRPPRLRRRRREQRDLRGRRGTDAARPREPVAQRVPRRSRPDSRPSSARDATPIPPRPRTWRIVNPTCATGSANRRRTSSCRRCRRRRCSRTPTRRSASAPTFAQHNLWVTPVLAPTSGGPRASTRTSIPATTGCRAGRRNDRSVADTDLVVWYSFGVTHFVRPEDWPVMPVEYTGFLLIAVRVLRPQPRARRAPEPKASTATRDARPRNQRRRDRVGRSAPARGRARRRRATR